MNAPSALPRCRAVALLIDGENLAAGLAPWALSAAQAMGPVSLIRVYGDTRRLGDWHEVPGVRLVHAHAGKNVTDMLMVVEAMELSHGGVVDGFALGSNDGDFTPLVQSLTARGFPVLGLVGEKAPMMLRRSVTRVHEIAAFEPAEPKPSGAAVAPPVARPKPAPPKTATAAARAALTTGPMAAAEFGHAMRRSGFAMPKGAKTWRQWLKKTFPDFEVRGKGPETLYVLKEA